MSWNNLKTLGINNKYTTGNRANMDYYATPPIAVEWLLKYEKFSKHVWEPTCGGGHISETLKKHGYHVKSTDKVNRGYTDTVILDFLECTDKFNGDIVSNPPYNMSTPFVLKALELTSGKVAFLMKLQFLETIQRYKKIFVEHPPARVYIFTKRIGCWKNGIDTGAGSAVCYTWTVWDSEYTGEPIIRWIPNYKPL